MSENERLNSAFLRVCSDNKVDHQREQAVMTEQTSKPKHRYSSRRPGTNPRTGEKLVPWEAVQVLDPELPTWTPVFEEVMIATEDGCRPQNFRVFVQGFITGEQLQVAVADVARSFGFTVVRT